MTITITWREKLQGELFRKRHERRASAAAIEAWNTTLGNEATADSKVDERVDTALKGQNKWVLIGGRRARLIH